MPRLGLSVPGGRSIKTVRVATGSVAGNGSAAVTVTWPQAFPNTSYTVVATVEDASDDLLVRSIRSRAAVSCVVFVVNTDALNAASGTIHAIAIAD